ncbi:MAG: KH domain-containing protein [Firmicutes bacterium]|nr:KH domain-containing protein [Bacillota bacterium]
MKELVEFLAKALVDNPDQVQVAVFEEEDNIRLELKVADADIGKVIGRQGRIAKAIRTVLKAAAVKNGKKVSLDILD